MLSVNDDLIQDNGRELKTFLTNNQFEKVNEDIMDKNTNKVTPEPTASSNQNIVNYMLMRIGFDKTISIINKYYFPEKNRFFKMTWEFMSHEMISTE